KTVLIIEDHQGEVGSVAYSPDGKHIVSSGRDGTVRIWDAVTGEAGLVLRGHQDKVGTSTYSPDGKWILSSGGDGTVREWDATTGEAGPVLHGHQGIVWGATYSPDGKWIMSEGDDGTIRIDYVRFEDVLAFAQSQVTRKLTLDEQQELGQL